MRILSLLPFAVGGAILIAGCGEDNVTRPDLSPASVPAEAPGLGQPAFYSIYWPDDFHVGLELIDTRTGAATPLVNFQFPDGGFPWGEAWLVSPFGVAFAPDATMYTIVSWLDFDPDHGFSRLGSVDMQTGAVTWIGAPQYQHFAGPEMDACGNLYATGFEVGDPAGGPPLIFGDSYLYRFDTATGAATPVGDTGRTDWMDLDFDSQGRLWATTKNQLWLIDPTTGAATFVWDVLGVPQSDIPGVCEPDWEYMEIMTIAFDRKDVLWATAMRGISTCAYDETSGPVMTIDLKTGIAKVVGYTNLPYNHGGDIMPTKVTVCHLDGNGTYSPIVIGINDLPTHRAHGDIVPGTNGAGCGCP